MQYTRRWTRSARVGSSLGSVAAALRASTTCSAFPYGESQARFREALEIIRLAWKGDPFSYHGQFHQFENATVSPRPYQVPHPPIRMAATTDETFPMVGTIGLPVFVGLRLAEISDLRAQLGQYRRAWRDAGHPGEPSVYLRVPVYAGTTEKAAVADPYESITYFFGRQAELARTSVGRGGGGPAERRRAQADRMANLTYEQILATKVAFGTASRLIDRLTQLRDELDLDGIVAELNPGGLIPLELERQSLRILAHEVMPALR